MTNARRFAMSLDRLNRGMTGAAIVVLVGVACFVAAAGPPVVALPVVLFLAGVLGCAWALAPAALEIDGGALRIHRRAWRPIAIPLPTITGVELGPGLGVGVRLWGVAGFFGSYGLFWTSGLGRFRAYVTRRRSNVLLRRRAALPVLVTPDDAERFAGTLRTACGLPDGDGER